MSDRRHRNAADDQQREHQRDSTSRPTNNHCLDDTC
jgi:hypothetical protein